MADQSFDAIIIGGGNKGLVTAMYLAKYGGMDVAIFEQRHELGGGWSSEESAAPGFITNTHAANIAKFYKHVLDLDFPDFEEKGGEWIPSYIAHGAIFKEDHSTTAFYGADHDPNQEKTAEAIAQHSERDAETWLKLWKNWQEIIEPAFYQVVHNPAPPHHEPDIMEKTLMTNPSLEIDPIWAVKSPIEVLRDLFESEALIAGLLKCSHAWSGLSPDTPGSGMIQFLLPFILTTMGCVKGGTHSYAHACHKIYLENGGKSFTKCEVEKVLIENGRAKGVRLTDGTEVEARKLVVSTLSPQQLCFQLMGEEYFQPRTVRRIKHLSNHLININWYHWAVHELPRYTAEASNPDIYKANILSLIDKDPEHLIREHAWRKLGKMPPDSSVLVWGFSKDDPTQAPEGKHIVASEQFVLGADRMSKREWLDYKKKNAEYVMKYWQEYAPNMNWENVIGYDPLTPYDCLRLKNMGPTGNWAIIDHIPSQLGKFRPVPELARHKTPVENLYATGAAWPFAGGAFSGQGYTCYKVIAEDHDLKKPWEGRPF
jgi:phytoene dehydrogenase-like protein